MATTRRLAAPAAEDTPTATESTDLVKLRCEDLGLTRDFTPGHAKDLLAFQESRHLTGKGSWQPVAGAAETTTDSDND